MTVEVHEVGNVSSVTGTTSTTSSLSWFVWTTILPSDGYSWYVENATTIIKASLLFQMIRVFLCTIFNTYFLAVIFSTTTLRKLEYYPVMLQSTMDLLWSGVFGCFHNLISLAQFRESGDFYLQSWLGNKVREFYHDNKWVICAGEFTRINVTAYVTGLTILMMAADRYVMVCYAVTAKIILTTRVRLYGCCLLTLFTLGPCAVGAVFVFIVRDFKRCSDSFYPNYHVRNLVDGALFLLLPGFLSLLLYGRIGAVLLRTRTQQRRNRTLTIAFITSCVTWILLSMPRFLWVEYSALFVEPEDVMQYGYMHFIFLTTNFPLYSTFPMINPLIFLFISRRFQQPIRGILLPVIVRIRGRKDMVSVPSTSRSTGSTNQQLAQKKP